MADPAPPDPPALFNFARDVIDDWARRLPDAPALWWVGECGTQTLYSFRQVAEGSRRAAHFFHRLGVRRGDRVLVVLPRVPQWWVGMLGLIRLGAVPIPGTSLLTEKDITYRVAAAEVGAVFTDADGAAKVAAAGFTGPCAAAGAGGSPRWSDFDAGLRDADPAFDPDPTRGDDPALLYFTSGTAGPAKMVLHTQCSYGLAHRATGRLWLDLKPGDLHWNLSDTGWAKAAWSSFYGPWSTGACVFVPQSHGKFDPAAALDLLARYPVNTWCAPPTALRMIVREDLSAWKFPALRHCVSAGEPLNPEVIGAWKRATGLTFHEGYGQTETIVMIANVRSSGRAVKPGSMGQPMPGFEIGVVEVSAGGGADGSGGVRELPDGAEGELAVRTAPRRPLGLFREYWRNPAENAARFRGNWYLTGDVGRRDADGYYWFVGRADDVIKSAGYRIGPFEVESALVEHPSVVEAAVVAKPDALRGQIVKAFVVLCRGCAAGEELKRELQEHCKRVTAPYGYPRDIEFVDDLPKTVSGKIRRVELRRRA